MSEQNPVIVNLPKDFLDATVRTAMVQALPEDVKMRLVEEVVRQALTTKYRDANHGYTERTVAEHALLQMVRDECRKFIGEWVEGQRDQIRKLVMQHLSRQLLTVEQAAEFLALCTRQVYRFVERGELAHVRLASSLRFRPEDLRAFIRRNRKAA